MTVINRKYQIGSDSDASKNFTVQVPDVQDGSLEIRRGNADAPGSLLLKFKLDGTAVIPGVLGVVSQSSGVPTGAILESGGNSEGDYTKFADGTMICRVRKVGSGSYTWTFPGGGFATAPVVVPGQRDGGSQASINTSSVTSTSCVFTRYTGASVVTGNVDAIAIGKWF